LVCSGVPFKADGFEVGLVNGQYIFLLFSIQSRTLLLLNSAYQQTVSITLDVWATSRWSHFIFDTDHFVHSNKNGSWQIDLDGELKEIPDIGSELFEKRTNQLLALDKKHKNFSNVFRNITNVYITIEGYLALNKHVLAVENNHIKLTQTIRNKPFLSTRKTEAAKHENVFLFKDGSEVHATRIGIIVLRSSDKTIPDICIPSILESSLGLSAGESFAGNVYYRKFKIDTKWLVADNFYDMYVKQFVRTIINYGT
jgi:hypothetical protein